MPSKVLDSFALIAYFRDETGAEEVEKLLLNVSKRDTSLLLSEVNYAEVKYSILRKDGHLAWLRAKGVLQGLPIEILPTNKQLAETAADFKAGFKLSLADAFAAALTKEKRAELVTGDPEFKALATEIKIHWLQPV